MDLTTGNVALSMVSAAATTHSGTEAAKTKSSLSAFIPAGSMAISVPPVASHRGRKHMNFVLLRSFLAVFCLCFMMPAHAASNALKLSCRHSFAGKPGGMFIILYLTFHNSGTTHLDVITCVPDPIFTFSKGALSLHLSGDWTESEAESEKFPIRERLLPRRLDPGATTTIAVQYQAVIFNSFPDITEETPVICSYRVGEEYSRRYGVWSGRLEAKSAFDPFYEKQKTEQPPPANPRSFGTSGMAPADSASRADVMPEASRDTSPRTLAKI
jgi:hypothetical protein